MNGATAADDWAQGWGALAFRLSPTPLLVLAVEHRDGVAVPGAVLDCSESLLHLIGSARHEVVGTRLREFLHPDDLVLLDSGLDKLLDPARQTQLRIIRPGWGVVWVALAATLVPDPLPDGVLVVALDDITAFRKAEQALAHRASHDPLTGLPNRAVLTSHLGRVVTRLGRQPGTVAVMFVDLDGFKNINDSFGHRLGDSVLKEVARRISAAVRRDDVVTRMGGDEFVVVCDALATSSESAVVAERIRAALDEPYELHGRVHALSSSVGVAQTSDPATTAEDLLRRADLAMYLAKERGRNRVEFFAATLEHRVQGRVRMVDQLRCALDSGRVAIAVQPVFRMREQTVVGHEALARLRETDGGVATPDTFLEPAVQSGLAVRLDNRVLDLGLGWLRAHGSGESWLSVNLSNRTLANARFPDFLAERLAASGLEPHRVVVDVGETNMMDAGGPTILTLRRLRSAGFSVALDDFGSSMSSLTAMRELPIDFVKVDRSFVAGLGENQPDESIVAAVIQVAHELGVAVVAEGVETPTQAEFLRERGCDLGQGYLFGPPALVEERP